MNELLLLNPVSYDEMGNDGFLGLEDLLEIGSLIDEIQDDSEYEDLVRRWGDWILLFPKTKKIGENAQILLPHLRYVCSVSPFFGVRRGWQWGWVNLSEYEEKDFLARMGRAFYPFKDANNSYSKGFGVLLK